MRVRARRDPPFVLKVNTIKAAGAGAIIDDVERHNRSLGARRIDRQHERRGVERGGLNLSEEAAAQRMAVVDPPAGVGLNAFRKIGPPRERGHSVEQKIADHVRAEGQNAVADKGRELHIDIVDMLLQRQHAELVGFVLNLVEEVAVERRYVQAR